MHACVLSHSVVSNSLHPMDCGPPGCSVHGILQAGNTGMDCHALLQGISLIQGLNPRLLTSLASTGRFFTASASCGARISIYFLITHWMKTKRFRYFSYSRGQPAGVSDFSWGGLCTCGESWIWLQLGCLSPLYLGLAGYRKPLGSPRRLGSPRKATDSNRAA